MTLKVPSLAPSGISTSLSRMMSLRSPPGAMMEKLNLKVPSMREKRV